jgi:biopolymer transport protein ExbB
VLDELIKGFSGPGAAFMYVITAVLALGLAVVLERAWLYWLRWRIDPTAISSRISEQDYDAAEAAAGAHPAARLIRSGATADSSDSAWDAMGTEAALVETTIRARVSYLAMVGNVATMLGLLGTVYGLIFAFAGLDSASAVERTARLSEGIGAAMVTTAWGLIVGIPALAAHALLDSKASRLLARCESIAAAMALSRRG